MVLSNQIISVGQCLWRYLYYDVPWIASSFHISSASWFSCFASSFPLQLFSAFSYQSIPCCCGIVFLVNCFLFWGCVVTNKTGLEIRIWTKLLLRLWIISGFLKLHSVIYFTLLYGLFIIDNICTEIWELESSPSWKNWVIRIIKLFYDDNGTIKSNY